MRLLKSNFIDKFVVREGRGQRGGEDTGGEERALGEEDSKWEGRGEDSRWCGKGGWVEGGGGDVEVTYTHH
jgi:hypothetical protein